MKRIMLALAALSLAGPAIAADLKAMPTKAPPLPPALYLPWSGAYVGGEVGGNWSTVDVFSGGAKVDTGSFKGGILAGYNWLLPYPNWLIGLEADLRGATKDQITIAGFGSIGYQEQLSWTLRARAGYLLGNTLLYVAGGYAGTNSKATITGFGTTLSPAATHSGFTAGLGAETQVWDRWRMRGEWRYTAYDAKNYSFGGFVVPIKSTGNEFNVALIYPLGF